MLLWLAKHGKSRFAPRRFTNKLTYFESVILVG